MSLDEAEHRRGIVVDLSHAALRYAIDERSDVAFSIVQGIIRDYGPRALFVTMTVWIDACLEHGNDGPLTEPTDIQMHGYVSPTTGALETVAARPSLRWAAELVRCRSNDDLGGFVALMAEPQGEEEIGEYIGELLDTCATSIRYLPRGFANMGRDTDG